MFNTQKLGKIGTSANRK